MGHPGKSKFPIGCPGDKIMHKVSDIAIEPELTFQWELMGKQ